MLTKEQKDENWARMAPEFRKEVALLYGLEMETPEAAAEVAGVFERLFGYENLEANEFVARFDKPQF